MLNGNKMLSGFTKRYWAIQLHNKLSSYPPRLLSNDGHTLVWTNESTLQETLRQMAIEVKLDLNNCCSIIQINIDSRCMISNLVKLRYHGIGKDGYPYISGA
jgi:hypothetical protein